MSVDGSVVIVTGGARGIGASLTRHLAHNGARVVIADVLTGEGAALADELRSSGHDVMFQFTDVVDPVSTKDLAGAVVDHFGTIDALVNNAAIYEGLGEKKHFSEIPVAEWDRVMAVNTKGVWLATTAVFPVMKQRNFGRVVNIASATVHAGVPFFAHYTASKGAVIALTRSIAREVGCDGVTVNAIAPGLVDNEASVALNDDSYFPIVARQRAVPRNMVPADLAGSVRFFCSAASGFITGQTLVVDGGLVFS
ncbi:SDR family oxidoreductase [Gordonia sp. TBRC 11910]|uniref:SDR family oxidoreductase n=2 Tax=Gordonia asplenii TaxID=2725283 RepID=A0A848L018_9ACTN|nr:SDR family oxidoreductase [Gordonia asplenii]